MGVDRKRITASPGDLINPEAAKFICGALGLEGKERRALQSLFETDPEAWRMLDDPRMLNVISESFGEKHHPRVAYYALLRHFTAKLGIGDPGVAVYMACLFAAAKDLDNPFLGEVPVPIMLQSDRQKCAIAPPETRRRLREKSAHICLLVLTLYRRSLVQDHRHNDGPDAEFYYKTASFCLDKLAEEWQNDGEEDLARSCVFLSEHVVTCVAACHKAAHCGLIAPPC
jgi:hypothetical protein